MLYIYVLSVHQTLQSVKAMTTHIKWVASSTHDSPVQLRLPFKASKHTLEAQVEGQFKWLEQWEGAAAYCCAAVSWVEDSRRGVDNLGARPRHRISSWSTLVRWAGFQSDQGVQVPATDLVVDAPLSDSSGRHMERIVAGQSPGRQSMGSGRYSCSVDAACRADGQVCLSARTESGVSNRCGRQSGNARHLKNTLARPGSAVDGQRAVPWLIECR